MNPDPETTLRLRAQFELSEARMRAALAEARAQFDHRGNKGGTVEGAVRMVLKKYLPRIAAAGHGEVIDSSGARSRQVDVVLISDDHPKSYEEHDASLFFVEGVLAAGEVKSVLTSQALRDSIEAAAQFKRLRGDPGKGAMTFSNPSDVNRFGKTPPYFLIAIESELTRDKIAEVMTDAFNSQPAHVDGSLDALLVLDRGLWINLGDGNSGFALLDHDQRPHSGWALLDSTNHLFDFVAWLSIVMPRIIRFAPILPRYMLPNGSIGVGSPAADSKP